jgi:hypothetical protein
MRPVPGAVPRGLHEDSPRAGPGAGRRRCCSDILHVESCCVRRRRRCRGIVAMASAALRLLRRRRRITYAPSTTHADSGRHHHARTSGCRRVQPEDSVEHRLGEPARERVLLTRVIRAEQRGPSPRSTSTPWPNAVSDGDGTSRAARPCGGPRRSRGRPGPPPPRAGSACSSATVQGETVRARRRSGRSGGAQCTADVTNTPSRRRPSSRCTDVGWLANPVRCSARNSHSPDRSPVNIRPVRFAPWAAGASRPRSPPARGSPKPGTGRPSTPRHGRRPASPARPLSPLDEARDTVDTRPVRRARRQAHSGSRASTLTFEKAFHSIHPSPNDGRSRSGRAPARRCSRSPAATAG